MVKTFLMDVNGFHDQPGEMVCITVAFTESITWFSSVEDL